MNFVLQFFDGVSYFILILQLNLKRFFLLYHLIHVVNGPQFCIMLEFAILLGELRICNAFLGEIAGIKTINPSFRGLHVLPDIANISDHSLISSFVIFESYQCQITLFHNSSFLL